MRFLETAFFLAITFFFAEGFFFATVFFLAMAFFLVATFFFEATDFEKEALCLRESAARAVGLRIADAANATEAILNVVFLFNITLIWGAVSNLSLTACSVSVHKAFFGDFISLKQSITSR